MEEIISQNSGTVDIWEDSTMVISQEDLTIAPIVLEPIEIDFSLPQSNNKQITVTWKQKNDSQKPERFSEKVGEEQINEALKQIDEAIAEKGEDALANAEGTRNLIKSFEGKTMEEVYDAAVSILVLLPSDVIENLAIHFIPTEMKIALSFMALMDGRD